MNAKSAHAKKTGQEAIFIVSILGCGAFLFAFTFLLNFPGYIANPIKEVTDRIIEISNRNYGQRIHVKSHDEFGEMARAFNTMAEKLEEFERSTIADLMTEKGRVESIVRHLNEGIILLDEEYKVKVINPVAAELLGVDKKDFIDKSAAEVSLQNDLFRELVKGLLSGQAEKSSSLRITLDNEENFFLKEIFKIKKINPEDGNKEQAGYIISLKNVTEFKKLDLAKTNFISIVSHELKTPISGINLSLKLLMDNRVGDLNEEQKKLVNSVKDEASRLLNITSELLDISQVETGNIRLTLNPTSPADIIHYALEGMKVHINEKNIHLIKEISETLPLVRADLEKTVWVVTNLLANAIHYTSDKGRIIVSAHLSLKEVEFSVQDTGPGIDARNKERIFQRFVQLDANKKKEGVGLGLAISKEFIQEQGGKIWLESELGVGSKFIFTLPVVSKI